MTSPRIADLPNRPRLPWGFEHPPRAVTPRGGQLDHLSPRAPGGLYPASAQRTEAYMALHRAPSSWRRILDRITRRRTAPTLADPGTQLLPVFDPDTVRLPVYTEAVQR